MGWFTDLLMLFMPATCLVCGKRLVSARDVLCLPCEHRLPRTGFHDRPNNEVEMLFWGRVPVEMGTSLFRFEKGSAYQALLHELKYRKNIRAGLYLGRLLGEALKGSRFSIFDLMAPVPLHPRKYRIRGYNQSEIIAAGASGVLGIQVVPHLLERTEHHKTQTSLGRYDRYLNVNGDFRLSPRAPDLHGRRILLIDDVVTTGSTLESCIQVLDRCYSCRVGIATISCA